MVRAPSGSSLEHFAGPRDAAIWALTRIERDGAYLDRLISEMHKRAGEDPRDQNLAEAIVKGVLENQVALSNLLRPVVEKFDRSAAELRAALFVGAAQLKVLTGVPPHAAVSETVDAARRLLGTTRSGLVNAVLRKVSASKVPLESLSGIPAWVNSRFTDQYGDESAELLEALDTPLPLFVRVNPLRCTIAECIELLAQARVTAVPFELVPQMLALDLNGARIPDAVFRQGVCTVQDPSAALAALALNPQAGERVLDLCAAPGGKTSHIAELMRDQGEIVACDINEKRLMLVAEHATRLGLTSVRTQQQDAAAKLAVEGQFDRILLDAPCTGTGVFAKKRDALAKKQEGDLVKLSGIQRRLLLNAVSALKPGGTLVYSTCSLDKAENEEQVDLFLKECPGFELQTTHALVGREFLMPNGLIKALPHKHHCAGAFAAVLVRK